MGDVQTVFSLSVTRKTDSQSKDLSWTIRTDVQTNRETMDVASDAATPVSQPRSRWM